MWLILVVIAAISLGLYNVAQKISLKENAVMPVLFLSILSSAIILSPFLLISRISPELLKNTAFFVPQVDLRTHFYIFIKSLIVLASWLCFYGGMKHLPLTIISPIKATQPIWTVLGAMLIFGETLNTHQATGVIITLISFYAFSIIGKKEGFSFRNNKWAILLIIGTLIGSCSGLYDKFLMRQFDRMAVLIFFTYYQVIAMGIVLIITWYPKRKQTSPFSWRWAIILIALFLSISDFLYFYALSLPDSLIAVISPLRRAGLIVPFIYGAFFFKEKNLKWKIICLIGLLTGVYFLFLGSW